MRSSGRVLEIAGVRRLKEADKADPSAGKRTARTRTTPPQRCCRRGRRRLGAAEATVSFPWRVKGGPQRERLQDDRNEQHAESMIFLAVGRGGFVRPGTLRRRLRRPRSGRRGTLRDAGNYDADGGGDSATSWVDSYSPAAQQDCLQHVGFQLLDRDDHEQNDDHFDDANGDQGDQDAHVPLSRAPMTGMNEAGNTKSISGNATGSTRITRP